MTTLAKFRRRCENHKTRFGLITGIMFLAVAYFVQKLLVFFLGDIGYWTFWAMFYPALVGLILFMKWFARIKYND